MSKNEKPKYGILEFLQPAVSEFSVYGAEIIVSVPISISTVQYGIGKSILAGLVPQALTYIAFRAYELIKPDSYMTDLIRVQKPSVLARELRRESRPKSIDSLIDSEK